MKSPATCRRRPDTLALALALALTLTLLTVASHAVSDESATQSYLVWRGPIVVEGLPEPLSATFSVVSIDGETIAVGTVSNDDGVRLTYIDAPLDDRPMVAVMRAHVDVFGLVELWSDGTCDHLETLRKSRRIPLWESASRIVEAMPKGSQEALRTLQDDPVMKRAAAELTTAFAEDPDTDGHPAASPR